MQETPPHLYASQISHVNKQEYDTRIFATFDSRNIAHVSLENLKNCVFTCVWGTHYFACVILLHSHAITAKI